MGACVYMEPDGDLCVRERGISGDQSEACTSDKTKVRELSGL